MPTRHTTVRLDARLLRRLKAYAKRHAVTMTAVLERAVEGYIAAPAAEPRAAWPWALPTFGRGGPYPGVDLADNSAIREFLDAEDGYSSST